ncbi:MAG: phosphatase PAP2 family protein [Algoriphagus sp.]
MVMKKKNKVSVLWTYFFVVLFTGLVLLPFYEKGFIELKINQHHHPVWDVLFSNLTHLGDGLVLVIPLLLLVFHKYCYLVLFALSSVFHLILVHIGKKWVFGGMPRPAEYLKDVPFYEVPGIELHHWGSFPSGHTTTAFMLASFLFLIVPKKYKLHYLVMGIAFFVGLSRVYLMQHFLMDIWAGALLGIFSSLVSYILVLKFFSKKTYQKSIIQNLKPKPSF